MKRSSFISTVSAVILPALLLFAFSENLFGQTSTVNDNLPLGNPSKAAVDLNEPDNYLVTHKGYTLSYNKSRGAANWVAWHLEKADIGDAERTNAFAPDTILPSDWRVLPTNYSGSGYDRGHLCPSKDRSASEESNRVTFLMSNMQPQVPKLNQKTWKYLEDYTRETVKNNEAYVYAGCYGNAGRIKDKVTIPTGCWKIVVVLPTGDNDFERINGKTRIIAVDMPNDETVSSRWRTYLTTVDAIEAKTGYDFLSRVPKKVQKIVESAKDNSSETVENTADKTTTPAVNRKEADKTAGNNPKVKKTDSGERVYTRGARGGCYYLTDSGNKSYVDKKFCENVPALSTATTEEIKTVQPQPNVLSDKKPSAGKSNSDARTYIKGARGGCYYLNSSGKKTYVDKGLCGN